MAVSVLDSRFKKDTVTIFDTVDQEKLPNHLKESLTKIIINEGFTTFKLETNAIETSGGNYLGELYVVQIKGNADGGYKEVNIFIKSTVPVSDSLDFISVDEVYLREIFVYTKLNSIFEELQSKANVPDNEKFKLVKFYDTGNKGALIMENLSLKGFKVPERLKITSLTFCEKSIESLARFHSLSFVMKKEKPDFFETEIKPKRYTVEFNETWLSLLKNTSKTALDVLESIEAKEKMEKCLSSVSLLDRFKHFYTTKDINVGVFCHGDYRNQNILVREKDGVVVEVMPLDYQLSHHGHPLIDIMYLIFGTTDQEFRKKHLDHLKNLYYDTMENYLRYFNINVENVYPKKQYEQDFQDKLSFGILIPLYHMTFMFAPEDDFPDLSEDLTKQKFAYTDIYIRCVNELIDDLIKWGIV